MARSVFFSFHYQRDIFRVEQVKRHYVTKGTNTAAGYFNGSLEEKAKKEGDQVVKKLIDNGLVGSSVLCVLIGTETHSRRWVWYEIFKAISLGMGVFGVRIHKKKSVNGLVDPQGPSPFARLRYSVFDGKLQPQFQSAGGVWTNAQYLTTISSAAAPYLQASASFGFFSFAPATIGLPSLFQIYDWIDDDGYNNFGMWVEAAARQAGTS